MNSFMSWVGGKKALREEVVRRFPLYYERYIEVFGGGGWVLFHKNPGNDFEVYNDFNGLLTNLYRCVREKPDLLMGSLRYVLNAREDFDRARLALRRKRTTSVQRAAWFYQIIRQSYASASQASAISPTICGRISRSLSRPTAVWPEWSLRTRTLRSSSGTTTGRRACSTAIRPTTARKATTQISERTALQRKTTSVCGML